MSRERLAKLLGMLGSDFDGERANAARMIADMAKKEGKGVADFVMSGGVVYRDRVIYRDRDPGPTHRYTRPKPDPNDYDFYPGAKEKPKSKPRQDRPIDDDDALFAGLRWARGFEEHLNHFEIEFIDDILKRRVFGMTGKQARVARRIIAKVTVHESDPLM